MTFFLWLLLGTANIASNCSEDTWVLGPVQASYQKKPLRYIQYVISTKWSTMLGMLGLETL